MLTTSAPSSIFSPEWRAVCPPPANQMAWMWGVEIKNVCFAQHYVSTGRIRVRLVCDFILREASKCPSDKLTGIQYNSEHFLFLHSNVDDHARPSCSHLARGMLSHGEMDGGAGEEMGKHSPAEPLCPADPGPRCQWWLSSTGKDKPSFSPRSTQVLALS